jgi:TolA-binding protein
MIRLLIIAALALSLTAMARADELWIGSGDSGAIQIRNAKVLKVENGQIVFLTAGTQATRELSKVQRIMLDDEPSLNAAEEAFAAGKWNDAVDGFQKTIRSTTKPWLRDWCSARLIEAANKSGRFDAAVRAYIALLLKDPSAAAAIKPTMPAEKSTYLDGAVADVNGALAGKTLSDEQRQILLTFLMDLHRARKDQSAEDRVAEQIDELLARDPTNPAAGQAIARRKLQSASKALEAKDFRKALDEIDAGREHFLEPQQQADALFIVAEARYGLADRSRPETIQDAALAYMRVVAHFKNDPSRPRVAEALLKTAQIHEQLNEPHTAAAIYEQVVQQFPDDQAAVQSARQGLTRLGRQSSAK